MTDSQTPESRDNTEWRLRQKVAAEFLDYNSEYGRPEKNIESVMQLITAATQAAQKALQHDSRDKQIQGQLHEISMALAVYENNPAEIYKYLSDRKKLIWNGLKEHQAERQQLENENE